MLEFFDFGIILKKPRENGSTSFAVDPDQLWNTLSARQDIQTGLLHEGTLSYARSNDKTTIIEYRPPQLTGIWLEGSENAYRIPMPGLILIRQHTGKSRVQYSLYAVKQRPVDLKEQLFRAPLPHVGHDNGSICWGSVPQPDPKLMESTNSLAEDWKLLLGSRFGNHTVSGLSQKHKKDVRTLYADLEKSGTQEYPFNDLVQSKITFGGLMTRTRS